MFVLETVGQRSVGTAPYYCLCARGEGAYLIGRHEKCHIRVEQSDVSRQHATLEVMTFETFLRQSTYGLERYNAWKRQWNERHGQSLRQASKPDGALEDSAFYRSPGKDDCGDSELMLSLVLCVRNHSKFGTTMKVIPPAPSSGLNNDTRATSSANSTPGSPTAPYETPFSNTATYSNPMASLNNTEVFPLPGGAHGASAVAAGIKGLDVAHAETHLISSVTFIPSITRDTYLLSVGASRHFKVSYRPIVVSVSQLHYAMEYLEELQHMYAQLGCTVLPHGNPVPIVERSSVHNAIVKPTPRLSAKQYSNAAEGGAGIERGQNDRTMLGLSPDPTGARRYDNASPGASPIHDEEGCTAADEEDVLGAFFENSGYEAAAPVDTLSDDKIELKPFAKFHICDEIDDSVSVLQALAIGYTIALPVYLFEFFALLASNPSRPLNELPHPSRSIGGAVGEPMRSRIVYGSSLYAYPESVTYPFSLFPVPASSSAQRSRRGLFQNRFFYMPNPVLIRKNGAVVAMCGGKTVGPDVPPVLGIGSGMQLESTGNNKNTIGSPNNNVTPQKKSPSNARSNSQSGATSESGLNSELSRNPLSVHNNNNTTEEEYQRQRTNTYLQAGRYTIVSADMEQIVIQLYAVAQDHFASYQRYPLAVVLNHPSILSRVLPSEAVELELRSIVLSVHRGWIPITERCVHGALLCNTFAPSVVEEFVMIAVEEQRQLGLHLRGVEAEDIANNQDEALQRRDLMAHMFGEVLAHDPATVNELLEQHNDALFAQLSQEKAAKYADIHQRVLEAGPEHLGGGLLTHIANPQQKDNLYVDPDAHIVRRSLPIVSGDHHVKKVDKRALALKKKEEAEAAALNPDNTPGKISRGDETTVTPVRPVMADRGVVEQTPTNEDQDFDSDATPSELDSEDFNTNKLRITEGYYTGKLRELNQSEKFKRLMVDCRGESVRTLRVEIPRVKALYDRVLRASGGSAAISNAPGRGDRRTVATRAMNSRALGVYMKKPLAHITGPTLKPENISYLNTLLHQYCEPQLDRLERCALHPEERAFFGDVQALWDEAEELRALITACLKHHERELSQCNSPSTQLLPYEGEPLVISTTPSVAAGGVSRGAIGSTPRRHNASNNTSRNTSRRQSPARQSPTRQSTSSRQQSPTRFGRNASVASTIATGTSFQGQSTLTHKTAAARRHSNPDRPGSAPVYVAENTNGDESPADLVERTKGALGFNSTVMRAPRSRGVSPGRGPAAGTDNRTGTAQVSQVRRGTTLVRYPPLPLFAAQTLQKSEALREAVSSPFRLPNGGPAEQQFIGRDPGTAHLSAAQALSARLVEKIDPQDTAAVARRRKHYLARYGNDEGDKRFILFLKSQSAMWTREFHRTLEVKGLSLHELFQVNWKQIR